MDIYCTYSIHRRETSGVAKIILESELTEMELKNTTKKNFVQYFLWLQSQVDLSILEKEKYMPIYFSAMEWYEKNVANAGYVELEEEDIECLLALQTKPLTGEEVSHITGFSVPMLRQKLYKLVQRGLVISYAESNRRNHLTYYKLSPLGKERLLKLL